MNIPILTIPESRWECLSCDHKDVTREAGVHSRFHGCRGMRGLSIAMVPAGTKGKVVAVERQDYIGKELVQMDGENRPIMSVVTERDEGIDCVVYAPTAVAKRKELP